MFFNRVLAEMYQAVFKARLDRYVLKHCEGLKPFTPDFVADIETVLPEIIRDANSQVSRARKYASGSIIDTARVRYDLGHAKLAAGIHGRSVLVSAFGEMSLAEQFAHLREHPQFAGQIAGHVLHPVKLTAKVLRLPVQAARVVRRAFGAIGDGVNYVRYYRKGDLTQSLGKVAESFEDPVLAHNLVTDVCSQLRQASKGPVGEHSAKILAARHNVLFLNAGKEFGADGRAARARILGI